MCFNEFESILRRLAKQNDNNDEGRRRWDKSEIIYFTGIYYLLKCLMV